jgi:hypothetical protein
MNYTYILKDHVPVPIDNLMEWDRWRKSNIEQFLVAKTSVSPEVDVSTIFLSLDHDLSGKGPPVLFETMIFGGEHDRECWRYSTWEQAEAGHKRVVEELS